MQYNSHFLASGVVLTNDDCEVANYMRCKFRHVEVYFTIIARFLLVSVYQMEMRCSTSQTQQHRTGYSFQEWRLLYSNKYLSIITESRSYLDDYSFVSKFS